MRLIAATLALITVMLSALPQPARATEGFASNVTISELGATAPDDPLLFGDGRTGRISDFRGDVLVVTLWQKNCPYCREEMPGLNRLSAEMESEGVRVLALGLDQDMRLIQTYLENNGYDSLAPVMDIEKINGSILSIEHFGRLSIATPTSFIVDKSGVVVARIWGLIDWDGDAARDYLRGLAAAG